MKITPMKECVIKFVFPNKYKNKNIIYSLIPFLLTLLKNIFIAIKTTL
ncbi:hypothetical protein DFO70_1139 [Cytobacillus firmus]|uniref:Uncharacterized protein n=2 Tax=Cytobacillus TaxID=2675230 RepID=A0A366JLT5_CYTFI|nr:hypothetical protein DFO70_1139 [Cytobacillus firmus]TDX39471.1 hypothetical protein DFO72_11067 [Cytobacillus oceanisediminis]